MPEYSERRTITAQDQWTGPVKIPEGRIGAVIIHSNAGSTVAVQSALANGQWVTVQKFEPEEVPLRMAYGPDAQSIVRIGVEAGDFAGNADVEVAI